VSTRPVIGICTAAERARWAAWDMEAVLLPRNYVDAVQRAGGLALLIPPDPHLIEDPDAALDRIDALMLAGGADVDPDAYGAPRDPGTENTYRDRDDAEIALARRALERDIPFLGICRGLQVMNVARGGTIVQHLPDVVGHANHRRALGTFEGNDHDVKLDEGSLAARAAGETIHGVKSHHHQGVGDLGVGLVVTGRDAADALPEAVEDPSRSFALGVQWHPEADEASRLIAALVQEAIEHRAASPR